MSIFKFDEEIQVIHQDARHGGDNIDTTYAHPAETIEEANAIRAEFEEPDEWFVFSRVVGPWRDRTNEAPTPEHDDQEDA